MSVTDRVFLRHALAVLSYRAAKAMRDAPPSFADFRPGPTSRTPVEVVAHMGDLFDWALSMAKGAAKWNNATPQPWDAECSRFFAALKTFDDFLASDATSHYDLALLFQGPVADALVHTGQVGMMRRLHGSPVKGESYNRADIVPGRIGMDQTPADPRYEFD